MAMPGNPLARWPSTGTTACASPVTLGAYVRACVLDGAAVRVHRGSPMTSSLQILVQDPGSSPGVPMANIMNGGAVATGC